MITENLVKSLKEDDELLDLMFPPKPMTIDEASEFLGIPKNTIYCKIEKIPHAKLGKRLIFTDRGLTRWMKRKPSVMAEINLRQSLRKCAE